jgi:putative mycofactocin binding protein MftB
MEGMSGEKYILSPGAQVREEDFGLLFYTMKEPRLYFMSSGKLLDSHFFQGQCTLEQWMKIQVADYSLSEVQKRMMKIREKLHYLCEKGVVCEC